MKKNATTKIKKCTKSTGKLTSKKKVAPKPQKTAKSTRGKHSTIAKNAPKKARERVTVSNYQRLAMRTCLPQCKCLEYANPELASEWHEAFSKIEGMRAKLVRLDGDTNLAEWKANKLKEIRDELGDVFWTVALLCELKGARFEFIFKNISCSKDDGVSIVFDYNGGLDNEFDIKTQIAILKRICKELGIKPSDCLRANIAKLSKRQAENKIQGDGDKR